MANDAVKEMIELLRRDACKADSTYGKDQESAKFLKKLDAMQVNATDTDLRKILSKLSRNEKVALYRARIKYIVMTCIKAPKNGVPVRIHALADDFLNTYVNNSFEQTESEKFNCMLGEFTQLVTECLKDSNFFSNENKKKLIEELYIQKKEVMSASTEQVKRLLLQGLESGLLATATVCLVATQGTACLVLSLPVVLAAGTAAAAYYTLISEVGFENALGGAEACGKNLFTTMKEMGLANLYLTIKTAHMIVEKNPLPFMKELVKTASNYLPENALITTASIAFAPCIYFGDQLLNSSKYKATWDNKVFENKAFSNEIDSKCAELEMDMPKYSAKKL